MVWRLRIQVLGALGRCTDTYIALELRGTLVSFIAEPCAHVTSLYLLIDDIPICNIRGRGPIIVICTQLNNAIATLQSGPRTRTYVCWSRSATPDKE